MEKYVRIYKLSEATEDEIVCGCYPESYKNVSGKRNEECMLKAEKDAIEGKCKLLVWRNMTKYDSVDELYKIAYKRYREQYPNKDFVSIPNFLDSLWFSIEGELNRNGYDAARKYVEESRLIVLKKMKR